MYSKADLQNKRFRLNNFYKIVDKDKSKRVFKENKIQKVINDCTAQNKIILKSRQKGVTTNAVLSLFDDTIFTPNLVTCILSHDQDSIEKIFNIARRAHSEMHPKIQPRLDKGGGSKYELRFPEIDSKIYCDLESRGDTIHKLHISEAAFADPSRMKATTEAVPKTGQITYESTPNGLGNDFYLNWIGDSPYLYKLFFPWYYDNEYQLTADHVKEFTDDELEFIAKAKRLYNVDITPEQIAYRRWKKSSLKDMYLQEYPEDDVSCFLASGNSAMDLIKVSELIKKCPEPISDDGVIKVYKEYSSKNAYVIGCDTAEGVRSDYSVAVVINCATKEVVATARSNNLKPKEFAHVIYKLAKMYWRTGRVHPLVGVECNNHGHAVLLALDEKPINYPNLYSYQEDRLGWKTDSITRPLMIDTFIDSVETGTVSVLSREILSECLTLIDNDGKIEAAESCHDDCVIACAIAIQMLIANGPAGSLDNLENLIFV